MGTVISGWWCPGDLLRKQHVLVSLKSSNNPANQVLIMQSLWAEVDFSSFQVKNQRLP